MGQVLFTPAFKLLVPKPTALPQPPPVQTDSFRIGRPDIVGSDTPQDLYPIRLEGTVQHGFGRGSKDLGCPTGACPCPLCNLHPYPTFPSQPSRRIHHSHGSHRQARGILWICPRVPYERSTIRVTNRRPHGVTNGDEFGVESILQEPTDDGSTHRVFSHSPLLKYTCIQEIHIMHKFNSDFYGCELKVLVLGYIRPELDYISRGKSNTPTTRCPNINLKGTEALIDDIEMDKRVSFNSLARPGYEQYASDPFFSA